MLISQDVMHALISPPLIAFTPLLSLPLTGGELPALGRLRARPASLCSTMRMGRMRVSGGMRLACHRSEPESDLWAGDALPSTVLLLCILFKGSTARPLFAGLPYQGTAVTPTFTCHQTLANCAGGPTTCCNCSDSSSCSRDFPSLGGLPCCCHRKVPVWLPWSAVYRPFETP